MTTEPRLAALRRAFSGEVIEPSDPGFDEARSTFNATVDRRPDVVVRPDSTEDVAAAVRWARDAGLPIAIRGGGHNVAGHATADGAIVVDLCRLRRVVVDPVARRARVGGGALWEDVDGATTAHGLAMPGGTFVDTGVGGLALGGGLGYLMGTGGLTCDTLVRAEVVTADGSIVIAGDDGDPDLLWALRGGGGNFGVVTEFEFALRPVGSLVAGHLSVPMDAADLALEAIAELAHAAPPELVIFAVGPTTLDPDADPKAEPVSPPVFNIAVVFQGTPEAAEVAIRPLRSLPIVADTMAGMSYPEVQAMNDQLPFGLRHYWKGHFLRDMDGPAIAAIVGAMTTAPETHSFVLLEAITGAARREPAGGAAFGQREARWNVSALAIWEDPADDARQIGWARDSADGWRAASLSGAGYANYAPVDETPDRVRAAYGPERFDRLRKIKSRYDPDNVFRFNLNIAPE
jgi:FAD/FMN-containing dehydrogenase